MLSDELKIPKMTIVNEVSDDLRDFPSVKRLVSTAIQSGAEVWHLENDILSTYRGYAPIEGHDDYSVAHNFGLILSVEIDNRIPSISHLHTFTGLEEYHDGVHDWELRRRNDDLSYIAGLDTREPDDERVIAAGSRIAQICDSFRIMRQSLAEECLKRCML